MIPAISTSSAPPPPPQRPAPTVQSRTYEEQLDEIGRIYAQNRSLTLEEFINSHPIDLLGKMEADCKERAYHSSVYDTTIIQYIREFARLDIKSYLLAYPEDEKRKINRHMDLIAHVYRFNYLGRVFLDPLEKPVAAPAVTLAIDPPRRIDTFSEQYDLNPCIGYFQRLREYFDNYFKTYWERHEGCLDKYEAFQNPRSMVPLYDLAGCIDGVLGLIKRYYSEVQVQKLVKENKDILLTILKYLYSIDHRIGTDRSENASLVACLTGIECEYFHSSAPSPFAKVQAKTKEKPEQEKPSETPPTDSEAVPALAEEESLNPESSASTPSAPPPVVARASQPRAPAPKHPVTTTTTTTTTPTTTPTDPNAARAPLPPTSEQSAEEKKHPTSTTSARAVTSARAEPAPISTWRWAMQGLGRLVHWRQAPLTSPDILARVSQLIETSSSVEEEMGAFIVAHKEEIQKMVSDLLEFLIRNPQALSDPNIKTFVNRFYRRMLESRIFSTESLERMSTLHALLGIR